MGSVFIFSIVTLMILFIVSKFLQIFWVVFLWPYSLTQRLKNQGINGPPYKLLTGSLDVIKRMKKASEQIILGTDSNDILHKILPHYHRWSTEYGETFLYWHGLEPHLCISDPELAKQILSNKFGFYVKPRIRPAIVTMMGKGLVFVEGLEWVKHRRIVNPAFSVEKLKLMVKRMAACAISMLEEWKELPTMSEDGSIKIEMYVEFQKLFADIIAHTAFGSNFVEGKVVFQAQKQLQKWCAAASSDIFIPGTQYLPTPSNVRIWKLDWKMRRSVMQIIKSRVQIFKTSTGCSPDCCFGDDLLGVMIASSKASQGKGELKLNMNEIVDECKTFFFAGYETTSTLLTWTIFLLSKHQEWQEKLREEVLKECGGGIPDTDMLAKLKLVNMVLLEALRLYGPVVSMAREALQDMTLGNLRIPKHTHLIIPLVIMHRSKEYWGEDANEFNPEIHKWDIQSSKAPKCSHCLLNRSKGLYWTEFCNVGGQNCACLDSPKVFFLPLP